jgi:hypothetical protein
MRIATHGIYYLHSTVVAPFCIPRPILHSGPYPIEHIRSSVCTDFHRKWTSINLQLSGVLNTGQLLRESLWRCVVSSGDIGWRSKYFLSSLRTWTMYVRLVFVWTFVHISNGFMIPIIGCFCLLCRGRSFELRLVVSYKRSRGQGQAV